jgi:hypothetical protein
MTVLGVIALLTVAGCTKAENGDGGVADTGRPPGTRWAQKFCIAYDEWVTSVTERLRAAQLLDPAMGPAAAHTTLTQVAAGARDDTTAVVGAVDAAGEPPIDDGPIIAVDIIHALQQAVACRRGRERRREAVGV